MGLERSEPFVHLSGKEMILKKEKTENRAESKIKSKTGNGTKGITGSKGKKHFLWKIWLTLGIICLLYFIVLIAYTGFTNLFYCIWLPIGIMFLIFARMAKTGTVRRMPKRLKILCGTVIAAGAAVFLFVEGLILSGFYSTPSEEPDYLIVLGAHVKNGRPSRALAKRLDAAFDYASEHENVIVIVSGGQGGNEETTEGYVMGKYLEEKGLERERIILEEKSTSTVENLRFSKELTKDGARIAVVSNDFHIYRAVHLAREAGFEDPQGLSARDDIRTLPANMMREFFGVVKDRVCGNMKLFPVR